MLRQLQWVEKREKMPQVPEKKKKGEEENELWGISTIR